MQIYTKIRNIVDLVLGNYYYKKNIPDIALNTVMSKAWNYAESLRTQGFSFKFSSSAIGTSFFNTVYYLLICSLVGKKIENKEEWVTYLNSFQDNDGIWRDKNSLFRNWPMRNAEWNDIHIIPHIIYVYEYLSARPQKKFSFLDKFLDRNFLETFLENEIDFRNFWGSSNGLMNYLVSLIYARDVLCEKKYNKVISDIIQYLVNSENFHDGMWYTNTDIDSLYDSVRGGYHVWMLLLQEGVNFNSKNIIDNILSLQNKLGGFSKEPISSTCANIDCIDPMVRFSRLNPDYKREEIQGSLLSVRKYLMHNQNKDGGFCFQKFKRLRYGNNESTSTWGESNIFATWFSLLALLIVDEHLNGSSWLKSNLPGMQYRIQ